MDSDDMAKIQELCNKFTDSMYEFGVCSAIVSVVAETDEKSHAAFMSFRGNAYAALGSIGDIIRCGLPSFGGGFQDDINQ